MNLNLFKNSFLRTLTLLIESIGQFLKSKSIDRKSRTIGCKTLHNNPDHPVDRRTFPKKLYIGNYANDLSYFFIMLFLTNVFFLNLLAFFAMEITE